MSLRILHLEDILLDAELVEVNLSDSSFNCRTWSVDTRLNGYAALFGDACVQCNLGVCYLSGFGTKPNLPKGIEWLQKAARKGDAKAQYNLGRAYLEGEGVRPNKHFANIWLEKTAAQNHRNASRLLRQNV